MPTHGQKGNTAQPQAHIDTGRSRPPEDPFPLEVAADAPVRIQLDFVQSAFANIQELNRTLDLKANYLLAAVALLTAALGIVVSGAITISAREDWQRILKGAGILLILLYLLLAFTVIRVATGIYQARSHRVSAVTAAPGMLFPLMLLSRYTVADNVNETAYLERIRTLRPDDMLQDYSNQIVEVSIIYEAKQRQLNLGLRLFKLMGILWLVTMLVVVMIIVALQ